MSHKTILTAVLFHLLTCLSYKVDVVNLDLSVEVKTNVDNRFTKLRIRNTFDLNNDVRACSNADGASFQARVP